MNKMYKMARIVKRKSDNELNAAFLD